MNWFTRRRPDNPQPSAAAGNPGEAAHAAGARSIAVGAGSIIGAALTGDNPEVVNLPPDAFRPITEVDAPHGIDNLPPIHAHFVGREHELTRLDTAQSESDRVLVQAVHGLGGIGKTALVAQWAATHKHGHTPMLWITADSPASVEKGLAQFAAMLQPALSRVLTFEQLADRALQWLATHSGWLLVLDNVERPTDIDPILARAHVGRILITSRLATGWTRASAVVLRVDVLEPSESVDLLTDIVNSDRPRPLDGATELCDELGHLPLAIEQAGAYLAQNHLLTPRDYLQLLARYPGDMYQHTGEVFDSERTIACIWRVTLDRITTSHPVAADILRTLAWYAPDAIPLTLLNGLANPPELHAALGALSAYNMITLAPATVTVSVHRLVQAVSRTLDLDDPQHTDTAIEHATSTLRNALPNWDNPANWPTWQILLPHIDALAIKTAHDSDTTIAILIDAAAFLEGQGSHERSIAYAQRVVEHRERVLGVDHPHTLNSRNNVASVYASAGRLDEAILLYELTLTDSERVLGVDHPDTLASRNNLANAYRTVGRFDEAIPMFEHIRTDSEQILGVDHPDTLTCRSNLAGAYCSVGRLDEAILLYARTLTDSEQVLGVDHFGTIRYRNNLANAYRTVGRADEAIPLFERALTDNKRICGVDHPHTIKYRNNLASAYCSVGRLKEAIPLYESNLTDYERILGADHPETLTSRNNLATAYEWARRLDEAIPLYEHALTGREQVLGVDHPDTLTSRNNLATAYRSVGRLDEAIPLYEHALTGREQVLGVDHSDTLTSRNNLAGAYSSMGRLDEAILLLKRTVTDSERVLGVDHPTTLGVRGNLAYTYQSAGRLDEALPMLKRTVADHERILGVDHPDTRNLREYLTRLHASQLD